MAAFPFPPSIATEDQSNIAIAAEHYNIIYTHSIIMKVVRNAGGRHCHALSGLLLCEQ